jgi:hypothetical protein
VRGSRRRVSSDDLLEQGRGTGLGVRKLETDEKTVPTGHPPHVTDTGLQGAEVVYSAQADRQLSIDIEGPRGNY